MKRLISAFVLALVMAPAVAQENDIGQVDLSPMADAIGTTPKVNINFGPAMMKGFAESLRGANPGLADVVASISGLRLMVFEDVDGGQAHGRVSETTEALAAGGWTAAMEVREDDTRVDLYLNESEQFVEGLVLMVTESGSGDAVFANIYGDLDPVVIGKLIGNGQALKGLDFNELAGQFQSMSDGGEEESGDGS